MRYVPPPPIAALPTFAQIESSCTAQTRAVIGPLRQQLMAAYAAYEAARPNTLHQLAPIGLNVEQRERLHVVFKRRQGRFREIWHGLTQHFEATGESTCPYCNFIEQWEHDHYLPRGEFPEFTLYPNNLVPICRHCNGKKLALYRQNGLRLFSHLFTELNGAIDFLKATVSYDPRLTIEYSVSQNASVSATQFEVLTLHFDKLQLADRYARQASTILARLVRQFRMPTNLALGRDALRQRLIRMAADRVAAMPPNHWESALMTTLAADENFTNHIFN